MPATIRIKRSSTGGAPLTLASGELAYSYLLGDVSNNGDRLFFGQGDNGSGQATSISVIGGKYFTDKLDHTPGTLTTSSAIVVDSAGKIDVLYVDDITINGNTIQSNSGFNLVLNTSTSSNKINFYNLYSFPTDVGQAGYALVSDGAGNLSWAGVSTAVTATNIAAGAQGQIPIQSASGLTSFIPAGAAGTFLQSQGTTASFVTTSTMYVANAVNAEKWATARTLTLSGELSGSVSIDGSQNVTLTATINASTLSLNGNIQSTSTTTGTLVVTGGVGIGGNLYVGGEIVAQKLTIEYTTVTTTVVETDDIIKTNNTTTSVGTTSGALVVAGGVGIGGDLHVGGTIFGTIDGSITTATNLALGSSGQIPYQIGEGDTGFFGPGTPGDILTSDGTNAPTYVGTSSIYVGNAVRAERWATSATITLNGDLSGSVDIDGSGGVTLTATIVANSVELGVDTTGDYVSTGTTSGFGISGSTSGESATFNVSVNSTSSNVNSTIVYRDGSGNFSAGTITGNLTGTASTATNLAGGAAGSISYQTAAGVSTFLSAGAFGTYLQINTSTGLPFWTDTIDGGTY